jgi:hypothetical protein
VILPLQSIDWKLCLEAGQHRKAALCELNTELKDLIASAKGKKTKPKHQVMRKVLKISPSVVGDPATLWDLGVLLGSLFG